LQKAKDLLAEAEQELSENRYDADRPRSLAMQANYEVKHAFYLASQVRRVNDDITVEQLILEWEAPLQEIASAADIVPTLSGGHDELQQQLVSYIENMRNQNQDLLQQVEGNESRLVQMETEMQALDSRLGGATQERMALMQRLEAQARIKEQFNKVEKMFTRSEARVFREHDDVILRLVGLSFDSGKSNIRPDAYDLLAKVKGAVALFPQSELVIEGHTDSYGSDAMNLRLSQSRAAAVRQYMSKTTGIPISRINAVGYGETRPVANNETAFGRAKNRRIDIVIKPNLDPAQYRDSYTLRE
jgi:OOP family OmpA-OmpF porin